MSFVLCCLGAQSLRRFYRKKRIPIWKIEIWNRNRSSPKSSFYREISGKIRSLSERPVFLAGIDGVDLAVTLKNKWEKGISTMFIWEKKDYLLEKDDENEYDKEQVEENVKTLSSFLNDMCEMFGEKQVSCLMIPSKTLALSKYLPAYSQVSEHTEVLDALQKSLSHPERMIYLKDAMQSHQNEYIYYRTDHHWTTLGAYYAYKEWQKRADRQPRSQLRSIRRKRYLMIFTERRIIKYM